LVYSVCSTLVAKSREKRSQTGLLGNLSGTRRFRARQLVSRDVGRHTVPCRRGTPMGPDAEGCAPPHVHGGPAHRRTAFLPHSPRATRRACTTRDAPTAPPDHWRRRRTRPTSPPYPRHAATWLPRWRERTAFASVGPYKMQHPTSRARNGRAAAGTMDAHAELHPPAVVAANPC
jgi:hypothetical protein